MMSDDHHDDGENARAGWVVVSGQLAAVSLVGAITFYFFGNAHDVTEKIDREIAERRGNKASDVDRGNDIHLPPTFLFVPVSNDNLTVGAAGSRG